MVHGDMASFESVRAACDGCDIVVHCALGTPYETIKGTQNVLRASSEFNVEKLIHISSVAVHGYRADPSGINPYTVSNEEIGYKLTGIEYCDTKIKSEKLVREYQKTSALPIVILRPTNIFGPFSVPWTIKPISMLKNRSYVLVNGGETPSNAVYIDNVLDAIENSIVKEAAIGRIITVTGDDLVSWKDFFSAYASMFQKTPTLYNLRLEQVKAERALERKQLLVKLFTKPGLFFSFLPFLLRESRELRYLFSLLSKSELKTQLITLGSRLLSPPSSGKTGVFQGNKKLEMLNRVPSQDLVNLFVSRVHYSTENAKKYIDYDPQTSFREGMELTEQWLSGCGRL